MLITLMAESNLPLGINFFEILLHMFNLAILIVGMRFLIYKPVKKFMKNRSEEYKKAEDESEQKRKEAEELKQQYEKIVEESRQNAVTASKEAAASALIQADEIIASAKSEASRLIKRTEEELIYQEAIQKEELSKSIFELAIDMAERILQREFKHEDNDAIIDNLISHNKADTQQPTNYQGVDSHDAVIQAKKIIADAQSEASRIVLKAEQEISKKAAVQKAELSSSMTDIATDMAKKILQREVKPQDNDTVIDSLIDKWKK